MEELLPTKNWNFSIYFHRILEDLCTFDVEAHKTICEIRMFLVPRPLIFIFSFHYYSKPCRHASFLISTLLLFFHFVRPEQMSKNSWALSYFKQVNFLARLLAASLLCALKRVTLVFPVCHLFILMDTKIFIICQSKVLSSLLFYFKGS